MFEVIISVVKTGRVRRRTFATRDQAGHYADERLTLWADKGKSTRDLRVEIVAKGQPAHKPEVPARGPVPVGSPAQPLRAA